MPKRDWEIAYRWMALVSSAQAAGVFGIGALPPPLRIEPTW